VKLKHLVATRYVLPLREGGSLPAIVDTDGGGQFVVKFRGAGQGPKALVAETLAAGLALAVGLPVPVPAAIQVDDGFGRAEPDAEIQDLLRASIGNNFGLAYLAGALGFDAAADKVSPDLAAAIVWFDALTTNVDRTIQNPNLLIWKEGLWLIDHGACFYFHHGSVNWLKRSQDKFPMIEKHILLPSAGSIAAADARLRPLLTEEAVAGAVDMIPDEWLGDSAYEKRGYRQYLLARLIGPRPWLDEAEGARRQRV
jgi:hypothetical protein